MYVYVITNTVNDKAYVGQTVQKPSWRWSHHLADARKGKKLSAIHRAITKYGELLFRLDVIGEVDSQERLNELERLWIIALNTIAPNGYNLKGGGNGGGSLHAVTKEKLRRCNLGKKQSPETIAKRVAKLRGMFVGRKLSASTIAKLRERKWTAEQRAAASISRKGRQAWNKGLKGAQVAWNKGISNPAQSERLKGKKTNRTPWNKGKKLPFIVWNKGRTWEPEIRKHISEKLKGKNYSTPEARRAGQIKRYSDPKQREIRSQLSLQQWAKRKAANE